MLDVESRFECATSFFFLISTSFSKRKVFFFSGKCSFKTVNDPPVSFLSSCSLFSIQLFAKSSSLSVWNRRDEWINNENDNDNDNDSDNDNDNYNDNDNDNENGNDKKKA